MERKRDSVRHSRTLRPSRRMSTTMRNIRTSSRVTSQRQSSSSTHQRQRQGQGQQPRHSQHQHQQHRGEQKYPVESNDGLPEKMTKQSFKLIRRIGRGGDGMVDEVMDVRTGKHYAMKTIVTMNNNKQHNGFMNHVIKELFLTRRLNHPNLIKYFKNYFTEQDGVHNVHMISELGDGDLNSFMRQQAKLSHTHGVQPNPQSPRPPLINLRARCTIVYQLLAALENIHRSNIMHRDLKPANVLIMDSKTLRLNLIDFGISRHSHHIDQNDRCVDYTIDRATHGYMAPELLARCLNYDERVDMWNVGRIMFELLIGVDMHTAFQFDFYKASVSSQLLFDVQHVGGFTTRDMRWILRLLKSKSPKEAARFEQGLQPLVHLVAHNEHKRIDLSMTQLLSSLDRFGVHLDTQVAGERNYLELMAMCFAFRPSQRITASRAKTHKLFRDPEFQQHMHQNMRWMSTKGTDRKSTRLTASSTRNTATTGGNGDTLYKPKFSALFKQQPLRQPCMMIDNRKRMLSVIHHVLCDLRFSASSIIGTMTLFDTVFDNLEDSTRNSINNLDTERWMFTLVVCQLGQKIYRDRPQDTIVLIEIFIKHITPILTHHATYTNTNKRQQQQQQQQQPNTTISNSSNTHSIDMGWSHSFAGDPETMRDYIMPRVFNLERKLLRMMLDKDLNFYSENVYTQCFGEGELLDMFHVICENPEWLQQAQLHKFPTIITFQSDKHPDQIIKVRKKKDRAGNTRYWIFRESDKWKGKTISYGLRLICRTGAWHNFSFQKFVTLTKTFREVKRHE